MPRTGLIKKRIATPDPIFNSRLVSKLVNKLMIGGKKTLAQKIVYQAFTKIQKETGKDPLSVFEEAVKSVMPKMEVRPRRVGGATYMVPLEVRGERREHLAFKFLIEAAKARSNADYIDRETKSHTFAGKLAQELIEAASAEGGAVKRRHDLQRMAEANKAFAHFRW